MSTLKFRHEKNVVKTVNGVKYTYKENILDGEKGLSFSLLVKKGESDFFNIRVSQNGEVFNVKETKGKDVKEYDATDADIKKMLKTNKDLEFVNEYMKDRVKGGKKKASKKESMKVSKKGSKKSMKVSKKESKKVSKKGSKKSSKKGSKGGKKKSSKKGSKKSSKKGSKGGKKKGSKKASKKGSKKASKKGSKKAKKGSKKSKKN
jgi:hypothetical protein